MRPALTDVSGMRAAAYQTLPVYASGMEIRHAFRMLVKDPRFTVVAATTLALGIGLNTVVFTVYESIALKPLAVRAPEEIVRVVVATMGLRSKHFPTRNTNSSAITAARWHPRSRPRHRRVFSTYCRARDRMKRKPSRPDSCPPITLRRWASIWRALGVNDSGVVISRALVLWQGLRPVGWGALIGLIGAVCLSGALAALVAMPDIPDLTDGASAFHPVTFLAVLAVLTVVVAVASFIPVRRATRVEPAVALRNE